jgi:AcrR family transcriptional regulator
MAAVAAAQATRRGVSRRARSAVRVGASQVTEVQRTRMLAAAVQVVGELGYEKMSVARVTARAGVSRRTFYDLFEDREECFLAVFTETVERARQLACEAAREELEWRGQLRVGLAALLEFVTDEPLAGRVIIVDALKAGPAVLESRARLVQELILVVEGGRAQVKSGREVAPLTAEGLVGAVLAVMHTRLSGRGKGSLTDLLNPLMAMIVLPYLGAAAAERELSRPVPAARVARRKSGGGDPLGELDMRLTYRTLRVLGAVAASPGASNRQVADWAEVSDQGQISKLLSRLESLGLIHNTGTGHLKGEPNAWKLTVKGREVEQALHAGRGEA